VNVSAVAPKISYEEADTIAFDVTFSGALGGAEQPALTSSEPRLVAVQVAGEDLYAFEPSGVPGVAGRLKDLTVDGVGDGAGVQGVAQISEDGSYVYFVAEGAFGDKENALHAKATAGADNLYVEHEGRVAFVAGLAANDVADWNHTGSGAPGPSAGPSVNTAVVSPDGEYFAFMSEQPLTDYDNTQSVAGECEGEIRETGATGTGKCREAFLYDAASGSLVCASCNSDGAQPRGPANLGSYASFAGALAEYRPRSLLNTGTLFFGSADELVPHASDGRENVYEFESGSVYPISDVEGGESSFFMDATPDGKDVFFATTNDLVPQDVGASLVVYDARVDGGFAAPVTPAGCNSGDSCKPPPAAPSGVFAAPAGTSLQGPGDLSTVIDVKTAAQLRAEALAKALKSCKKERPAKKRAVCSERARRRYGPGEAGKARKASEKRGGGR
jgi:hypothetical protein